MAKVLIMEGLEIKQKREQLGLTQKELGDLIGASRETIINYEKGRPIPKSKSEILNKVLEPSAVYNKVVANEEIVTVTDDFENKTVTALYSCPMASTTCLCHWPNSTFRRVF